MAAQNRSIPEGERLQSQPLALRLSLRFGAVLSMSLFLTAGTCRAVPEATTKSLAEQARGAAERGAYTEAETAWRKLVETARHQKDRAALADGLTELGSVYHAAGQFRRGEDALNEARDLAEQMHDNRRMAAILRARGALRTFSHKAEFAESDLNQAIALARKAKDRAVETATQNDLGILLAATGKYAEADQAFAEAAGSGSDPALAAKAAGNRADCAVQSGDFHRVRELNQAAIAAADHLPDSHDKLFCLIHAGKTWEILFERGPEHEQSLRLDALRIYQRGAPIAESIGDKRALSYALGYSGHLYEQEKKYDTAQTLTRRALFLAQQAQAPDILYLWEWQTARLDAAQGHREEAIAGYQRCIRILDTIRNDLSNRLGNANARSSFREAAGEVYFGLADLLLQRVDGMRDEATVQAALKEARDTCETLKAVELEDYFQDDCVSLLKAKTKGVEAVSSTAAIIYIVPLKDRTEIITSVGGKLDRIKSAVTAEELTTSARAFRQHLQTQTTEEYLGEAQQLYTWLIQPVESLLQKHKIDTLVFVPDGALRSIPMSALHDGSKFLIEKYAIAVTPGLTLMEPQSVKRTNVTLMANALTEPVNREGQQFPALPYVKQEVAKLHELYGGTTLMNQDFRLPQMEKVFSGQSYTVVHIASHGEFSSDVHKTFLLTYDGTITLDGLERLIRPSQLREHPVEMLSLSACQTAAGDDRAALGLAGVAVKAGARSAFATLWYVNDAASTQLVSDFYTLLRKEPELSKAKALQEAQVKLLSQPATSHPCLWAPYILIGNWL